MNGSLRISESEWEVMNLVWRESPATAAGIVAELSERKGWHVRTIRTLIDRLVRKGALKIKEDGRRYLYYPGIRREVCVRQASQTFMARVFEGAPASLVLNLVRKTPLDKKEIAELRRILDAKEDE
ncbi:MAG: BlaI/MecI/CopY family transcriptional regulator [Verrucomicrobia bacterium]|nr:BlaI/MecI/CopY family transcriptional regulator [Verrucomicrobiota bacterium]